MSLRKIFFNEENMVVALAEVGSEESDVTYKQSSFHRFVKDDSIEISVGCTFKNNVYIKPLPVVENNETTKG